MSSNGPTRRNALPPHEGAAVLSPEELARHCPALESGATLWVAYSGGLDSTVLLTLLARAGIPGLRAVHVHHGLQAAADAWTDHCAATCQALAVPLEVRRVAVDKDDPAGPEAAARTARLSAFRDVMRAGDVIATAHHLDDQAETVLLRLCRGTGVDGLAGMRRLSRFPPGRQWRPLLTQPRAALRAFAQAQDLRWIEDPQNRDPRFSRSWLRHNVMPLLRTRWPAVDQALARSADHAASTATLLRDLAELDLHALRSGPGLSIEALLGLTAPRRRNALRAWLRDYGLRGPANDVLQRIEREVLSAADDAQPCLQLEALELRRYRDVLRLMPKLPPVPPAGFSEWSGSAALDLPPGCGRLEADAAPPVPLRVRFVQGGESIRPGVTTHSRSLKNLFQEAGIPPWVRQRAPLLFREERLVAVADLWLELDFQTLCARQGWSYRWQRAPELGEGA